MQGDASEKALLESVERGELHKYAAGRLTEV